MAEDKGYVFKWKGKKYSDFSKTLNEALSLPSDEAKEFADKFMKGYRKVTKFADTNIGYVIGYYDNKERKKLYKIFNVNHPIFGRM
jgi:hypothetical protein